MTRNVGTVDKVVRIGVVFALMIGVVYAPVEEWVKGAMGLLAMMVFTTAILGWCWLWKLLGINTIEKKG